MITGELGKIMNQLFRHLNRLMMYNEREKKPYCFNFNEHSNIGGHAGVKAQYIYCAILIILV